MLAELKRVLRSEQRFGVADENLGPKRVENRAV